MNPVELVILDCDGVLVDSERLAARVEVELLAGIGLPMTEAEVVERFLGRSDAHQLAELERLAGRPLPDWPDRYRAALAAEFERALTPVPGIVEALDDLAADGRAMCVASSGTHDKMRLTLGITGLDRRFEGRIFSATEVGRGKPAPDLFLHAAGRMGVEPPACVVVEDSPAGAEAALAAGMRCLAYTGGVTPIARLEGLGAVLFPDMLELPALIAAMD